MPKHNRNNSYMHNKLKKSNKHDLAILYLSCNILIFSRFLFTKSDIIENRDVLMTIIMMLKFTQSPRPS